MVAKVQMGKALVFGRGTDKNIPKGYTYIEESATGGNTEAMLFMGEWCLDKENSRLLSRKLIRVCPKGRR